MNAQTMAKAKREANRFLDAVAAVEPTVPTGRYADAQTPFQGSAATGALRRASMDLTRALAELRR
jgi:hypothetical protein